VRGDLAIGSERPQKANSTKPLDVQVGRFRSVDVFSIFPVEFSVLNSNYVPGDRAIGSERPQKANSTKPLDVKVGRFRSVDVFSTFPMELSV